MNLWAFTGNLGRDSELRYLPNGDPICSFSVGIKYGYGEKATTTWANCSLFGKRAESIAPYLKKGQQVACSGEVTLRTYINKEGAEKTSLDVRVANIDLTGGKSEPRQQEAKPAHQSPQGSGFDDMDSDIPF